MVQALLSSMSLVGVGGQAIIAAIFLVLVFAIGVNLAIRTRYALLDGDLRQNGGARRRRFRHALLNAIEDEAREVVERGGGELNTQAVIEHNFQREMRGAFVGERFVKASTGLMIILGLVGTFYGLTLSIAKLTNLVAGDGGAAAADLTQSLTRGLTEALSGMSVAFSTSLVGIVAAVVMTLFGVFSNLTDRRLALMVRIEHYVDHLMMADPSSAGGGAGEARWATGGQAAAAGAGGRGAARTVDRFGQSVAALEAAVTRFEGALQGFAATTRDFREFNLHLKDNVQRMSLTFGDLSETLKDHVRALRSGGGPS